MHEIEMKDVIIVERSTFAAAGLEIETSFAGGRQAQEIPPFFHETYESGILETIPGRLNENKICIFTMHPQSPKFSYFMGIEYKPGTNIPDSFVTKEIQATTYASIEIIKRGNEDVGDAFIYLIEEWLPQSMWQMGTGPTFIYYDSRFKEIFKIKGYLGNPPATIYIPIV